MIRHYTFIKIDCLIFPAITLHNIFPEKSSICLHKNLQMFEKKKRTLILRKILFYNTITYYHLSAVWAR